MPEMVTIKGSLRWKPVRIIEVTAETPRMKTLVIEVPGWEGHRPGQHVDVRLTTEDGYSVQHSYSIASSPTEKRLRFLVGRADDGKLTLYLVDEPREGYKLEVRGPIGAHFTWDTHMGGPLVLVAGGSGIAPLMSMIRHRTAVGSDVPTRLLYSSRSPDDIAYRDELDYLVKSNKFIEVVYTLTRIQPPVWTGYRRRIDKEMLNEVAGQPERNPLAFVCGPAPLVQTVVTGLVELGHKPARIKANCSWTDKRRVTNNAELASSFVEGTKIQRCSWR